MTKQIQIIIILVLGIVSTSCLINEKAVPADASPTATVPIRIEKVVWGTDFNAPETVTPNTIGADFSVSISNLSNTTLSGIQGKLFLNYPFTDYSTETTTASSQGEVLDDSFNRETSIYYILAGEVFFFQFSINVDSDAITGNYPTNLEISYLYNVSGGAIQSTPENFSIDLLIANRAPTIDSSYPSETSLTIEENEKCEFGVYASDPDNQTLAYRWKLDNSIVSTAQNFTFIGSTNNLGYHSLEALVKDPLNLTATTTWDLDVIKPSITTISLDSQYIFAGYKTDLIINVSNSVWQGAADITLSVPDEVIIHGANTWNLTNLSAGTIVTLFTTLYAPNDLLGTAGDLTFDIEFLDYLGNSQSESITKGIIIRGKLQMVIYDKVSQYSKITGRITLSANILNKGTVSAMFVNVSLTNNPYMTRTLESSTYIGELETNDPVPFSIGATLASTPSSKVIITSVLISWTDDLYDEFTMNITFIVSLTASSSSQSGTSVLIDANVITGSVFTIGLIAIVSYIGYRTWQKRRA